MASGEGDRGEGDGVSRPSGLTNAAICGAVGAISWLINDSVDPMELSELRRVRGDLRGVPNMVDAGAVVMSGGVDSGSRTLMPTKAEAQAGIMNINLVMPGVIAMRIRRTGPEDRT